MLLFMVIAVALCVLGLAVGAIYFMNKAVDQNGQKP